MKLNVPLPQQRPKPVQPTFAEQAAKNKAAQDERIKATATAIKAKLIKLAPILRFDSWEKIEKNGPIVVPDSVKSRPYSFELLEQFLDMYVEGSVDFAKAELDKALAREITKVEVHANNTFGIFKLRPRQQKALDLVLNVFLQGKKKAVYLPLPTGGGKSIIAGAFFKTLQEQHKNRLARMPLCRFLFITKKKPAQKIKRAFVEQLKLSGMNVDVHVIQYGDLRSTKPGKLGNWFKTDVINIRGNEVECLKYNVEGGAPMWNVIVIDEGHVAKHMSSLPAQAILALKQALPNAFWVWTSATPGVVIQDLQPFCITAGFEFSGVPVDRNSWPGFAAQFTNKPNEINNAAFERFIKYCGDDVWIRPPADRRRYKFTARTVLLEFENEKHKKIYYEAEANYIEACKRAGQDKSLTDLKLTRFILLRSAEEFCKAPHFARRALKKYNDGFAPVIGVCFEDTLCDIVRYLTDSGIPRDKICVIHGGRKKVNPKDLLSRDEELAILAKKHQIYEETAAGIQPTVEITKEEKRRFKITCDYRRDRLKRDESREEKAARELAMSKLKLHHQTDAAQQQEIDEFQAGTRWFAVYTFASGGTGIDLDDQLGPPLSRPRDMDSTICYYGEEFVQSSGRVAREGTVSDVIFNVLFFAGTIAAAHVAPLLLKKLHAIQTLAAGTVDLTESLEKDIERGRVVSEYVPEEEVSSSDDIKQLEEEEEDDDDEEDDV